jgi:hypothetical protein
MARTSGSSGGGGGRSGMARNSAHGDDDDDDDDDDNDHHTVGHDGVPSTGRRQQRRSTNQKPQVLKLDIAELAKQGYLEVHDGKMRLIIDVEKDAY